jgi:hypothetical protein
MAKNQLLVLTMTIVLLMNGCTATQISTPFATLQTSTPTKSTIVLEVNTPQPADESNHLANVEELAGFDVKEPTLLPAGYVLEDVTVEEVTHSVCLHYRYAADPSDGILLIAQGDLAATPPLELIPGWPEYSISKKSVSIGGAKNSFHIVGWQRNAWACTQMAEKEKTRFSYALAPWFTWEADNQQFDLYSVSGGCGTPGGLTNLDLLRIAENLTENSTHAVDELDPDCLHSISDAEKMADFDIQEPTYLPNDVSFYFATYQTSTSPAVTLNFLHEEHRDMGRFFQIVQTQDSTFFVTSCDSSSSDVCEMLQVGNTPVVYQFSGASEQLSWQSNGFFFSLFRNAGEPGKVYKDDLLRIVESMN